MTKKVELIAKIGVIVTEKNDEKAYCLRLTRKRLTCLKKISRRGEFVHGINPVNREERINIVEIIDLASMPADKAEAVWKEGEKISEFLEKYCQGKY
jgi:hypothetical protein